MDNPILHHFVTITIFSLMLSMGINHTFEDVSHIWRDSGLLLRSLLAVVVLVPVVVALILWTIGLPIAVAAGLVVLAASAGAPMTYKRTQMTGGDPIYAISLQLTLALLAVMITPMTLAVFYTLFELPIARVTPFHIAFQVGEVTFLPVMAGLLLRRFLPKLAEVIGNPVKVLANILFVILALILIAHLVVAPDMRAMVNVGRMPVAAIMVIVAGGLVLGHLLGGPSREKRSVLAVASIARNIGLALFVAGVCDYQAPFVPTLVAYMILGTVLAIPYSLWSKRQITQRKKP